MIYWLRKAAVEVPSPKERDILSAWQLPPVLVHREHDVCTAQRPKYASLSSSLKDHTSAFRSLDFV
jgi:hypothetical protein